MHMYLYVCNNNKDKEGMNLRGRQKEMGGAGGWQRKDANAAHIHKI